MGGGSFASRRTRWAVRRYRFPMTQPQSLPDDWEPPPEPRTQTKVPVVKTVKVGKVVGARRSAQ